MKIIVRLLDEDGDEYDEDAIYDQFKVAYPDTDDGREEAIRVFDGLNWIINRPKIDPFSD